MLILWCQEHQTANRPNTLGCWIGYDLWEVGGKREDPACRMVPMRLIPDNAETIERIGTVTTDPRWSHIESPLLLEFALAVLAALDGETP